MQLHNFPILQYKVQESQMFNLSHAIMNHVITGSANYTMLLMITCTDALTLTLEPIPDTNNSQLLYY